ncbi:MAG: flagellar hook-length control protein FliK [Pirellulaceae bacterium]|nr:flagellar hook-length control protein FliK [Pirellulaceae bacterium]
MTKTHTVRGDVGMDGSAATSFAERTRSQISRAFSNRSANEVTAQSELFEQLLNLKFTVEPPAEKPSPVPESSIAQTSSTVEDKAESSNVDEEKDDEPTVALATLTPAVPLVQEEPVELASDTSTVAVATEDAIAKTTELDANQVDPQVTVAQSVSQDIQDATAQTETEAIVDEVPITDANVNAATNKLDSATAESSNMVRKPSDDSRDKPDVNPDIKLEENANPSQGLEELKSQENEENSRKEAQPEMVNDLKPAQSQREDSDDRRGDRRERWFERKEDLVVDTAFERPDDTVGLNAAAKEELDLVTSQVKEALQPVSAASSVSTPEADSSISTPVAPPATVSISSAVSLTQASAATTSSTTTSTSGPESTAPITAAPTRTIGHQAAKAGSNDVAPEPGLSQQERVRVIQRIARSFNRISAEGGSINLRLHPEHLGSVSVQVRLEGRSLSARLSTETSAARDAIMQDLPALRQRLADQGFDVTKFQVEVAGNGADASFAQSNSQSQFSQSDNRSPGSQTDYRRVAAMREARAATVRQLSPSMNVQWQPSSGIDLQA